MTAHNSLPTTIDGSYPTSARNSLVSAVAALTGADPSIRGVVGTRAAASGQASYTLTPPWRPRLLIPTGFPQHARVSVAAFGHHRSEMSNRAGGLLSQLMSNPASPALMMEFEGPDGPLATTPLAEFLSEVFGVESVVLAVRAVLDRPNAKPVVIVMSETAEVLGFCKVGWDELTRALIVHERATLDRVRSEGVEGLRVPETVFGGSWSGLELLVTRPVSTNGQRLDLLELVRLACKLAERQSVGDRRLGDCGRVSALRRRITSVELTAPPRIADSLRRSMATIDRRWGDDLLLMGREHGDFVVTNAAPSAVGLATVVWDWERSAEESPVGLDAAHAVVAHLVKQSDRFDRLVPMLSDMLVDVGGPADHAPVLALLDLTEMVLRHEEARLANLSCDDPGYAACLHTMLRFFPA